MKSNVFRRWALFWAVLLGLSSLWAERLLANQSSLDRNWTLCADHAGLVEVVNKMPRHLLLAIAQVESGRWHGPSRENLAWPWTVMAEGKGRFLPSKEAAIAEVRALQTRGVTNIDVGCMQINLHYHGDAFDSLAEAFDPPRNLAYAATFLSDLRENTRSWTMAIGQYHSKTPALGSKYRRKVLKSWREVRHRENRMKQEALKAARQSQRADSNS